MPNEETKAPEGADVPRTISEDELREFLQSSPLYRHVQLQLATPAMQVRFPQALSMACPDPACKAQPTTTWQLQVDQLGVYGPGHLITYGCAHCGRMRYSFWVLTRSGEEVRKQAPIVGPQRGPGIGMSLSGFRTFTLFKIGQYPGWSITPPKEVERARDPANLDLYKKGLVNMSQAYGIGALGYFRRVIENIVGSLLDLVEEAAKEDGDEAAIKAVQEARAQKQADRKLEIAAKAVPPSLRPGGANPLANLYEDYSRGLHGLSDAECLEIATEMRDAIEYLFGNLRDRVAQAKAFRKKITRAR